MQRTTITIETNRKITITRSKPVEDWQSSQADPFKYKIRQDIVYPIRYDEREAGALARSETVASRQKSPTQDEFDSLLAYFSPDRDEAGKMYETIRRKLIKLFECRGCFSAEELADVTINRVARRISGGTRIWAAQPSSYFYGVARNVLMDYQRHLSKADLPLEEIDESRHSLNSPFEIYENQRERQQTDQLLQVLDAYLRDLPAKSRELILDYYQKSDSSTGDHRRILAERLAIPANALRIRAYRIRTKLRERFAESFPNLNEP